MKLKMEGEGNYQCSQSSDEMNFTPDFLCPSQNSVSSISSAPSPIFVKLGDALNNQTVGNYNNEERIKFLNIIIPQLETLDGITEENVNKLAKLVGNQCHQKLKSEANFYRLKRSRDEVPFQPAEILEKQHNIEILHIFFESATQKSGRVPGPNREKIAQLQANFYESTLKGTNLNAIGPYNFAKTSKVLNHVQSKKMLEGNLGGSYSTHNRLSVTEPLPVTQKGPLISDNAQRGKGKYQHHAHGKLDRAAPVTVVTHHIRVESLQDKDDNAIFLDPSIAPCNFEHHPVFRPVDDNFLSVVEARLEQDAKFGRQASDKIVKTWIEEVKNDKQVGGGTTSFEKVREMLNFGTGSRNIVCQKCHKTYLYDVSSQNICPNNTCKNNPTYYEDSDMGPYKKYNFPLKSPNTVIVVEQEPSPFNPNGRDNLKKLHTELKTKHWEGYEVFPFYGEGLPGITYERMKTESVHCTTHNLDIPLSESSLLAVHCNEACKLDWPLKNLYVICGESHEEILMNTTALKLSIPFGVLDLLADMGRHTKQSQLQAIREAYPVFK